VDRVEYLLRAKSGGWSAHPDAHDPAYRLLSVTMTAERRGRGLRNEFARAPDVALQIVGSIEGPLSSLTARATAARGVDAEALTAELFAATLRATGPDHWR